MKYLLYICYALVLVVLMYGVFAVFSFQGAVPNVVLLALISMLILDSDLEVLWVVAVSGGTLVDLYSGLPFGTYTLGLMVVISLLYVLEERVLLWANRIRYLPLLLLAGHILLEVWVIGYGWVIAQFVTSLKIIVHPLVMFELSGYRFLYHLILLYPIYVSAVAIDNLWSSLARRFKLS